MLTDNRSSFLIGLGGFCWAFIAASSNMYTALLAKLQVPGSVEIGALPVTLALGYAILSIFLYRKFRIAGGLFIAVLLTLFCGLIAIPLQSSIGIELSPGMSVLAIWLTFLLHYTISSLMEWADDNRADPLAAQIPVPVLHQLRAQEEQLSLRGKALEGTSVFVELDCLHDQLLRTDPSKLMPLISQANEVIIDTIKSHMGTAEIAPGGAVAAFWQHSENVPEQTISACNALLQIRKNLSEIEEEMKNLPNSNSVGWLIGVHSGKLAVGNVGSSSWERITSGGPVALGAQQLARLNTLYGSRILLTQRTYDLIHEHVWTRKFSRVRLPGEPEPLYVNELLGLRNEALGASQVELLNHFQEGLELYIKREWKLAANRFRQALQIDNTDEPSRIYLLRCQEFLLKPPPLDWNGVYAVPSATSGIL